MPLPKFVLNYQELRNIAPPVDLCDYVFVGGFPDPDSRGLKGFFEWRLTSLDQDDGGTVMKPAALQQAEAGRWHRVFDSAMSIKWFAAIGDGNSHPLSDFYATLGDAQQIYNAAKPPVKAIGTFYGIDIRSAGSFGVRECEGTKVVGNTSYGQSQRAAFGLNPSVPVPTKSMVVGNLFLAGVTPGVPYELNGVPCTFSGNVVG